MFRIVRLLVADTSNMDDVAYHAMLLDMFRDGEEASERAREDASRNLDYYDGKQFDEEVMLELHRRGQPALVFNVVRPKIDFLQGLERTQRTKPRALPRTPADEDQAHAATDALRYVCDANDYDDKRSRVWGDMLKVGWGGHEITVEPKPARRAYPVGGSAVPFDMGDGPSGNGGAGNGTAMASDTSALMGSAALKGGNNRQYGVMDGGSLPASPLMGSTALTPPPAPAGPEYDVKIRRCQWDRMLWDPYSREDDFSDASFLGMVVWMDRDEAVMKYGEDAAQVFDETISSDVTSTYSDKPIDAWVRYGSRKRIRIVQLYHLSADDGEWDFCEFTRGGILQSGPSPWLDEDGKRQHPYAWRSAYIDGDNDRYGPIRDMRPVQDEINQRRSKALHHFTVRQTYGRQGALGDKSIKDLRRELARPDGYVEFAAGMEWGKDIGVIQTNDMAGGHMRLLEEAQAFFATNLGPNPSMNGTQGGAPSGRALLASQQGGTTQLGTLTDALRQMDYDCYRKVWLRVKQFCTDEWWIRITDDMGELQWVGLNTPAVHMDPQGQPMGHPMTGQPMPRIDPTTGMQHIENDVAALDVDIIIDEQPANGTMPDEQFAMLIQLKQMDQGNTIPFSTIVDAAPNLRNKSEMVQAIRQRENQPPNPVQVAGAQAEVAGKQADADLKHAQAAKTAAEIPGIEQDAVKTQAETRKTVVDTHGAATSSVLDAVQAAQGLQYPLVAPPAGYTVPA